MTLATLTLPVMSAENSQHSPVKSVGARIRAVRKAKGWKQHHLAEALQVSTQTVNRYENGERNIYADKLIEIADALGVPVAALFENGDGLTQEERSMIEAFRANPHHLSVIRSTLKALRDLDEGKLRPAEKPANESGAEPGQKAS